VRLGLEGNRVLTRACIVGAVALILAGLARRLHPVAAPGTGRRRTSWEASGSRASSPARLVRGRGSSYLIGENPHVPSVDGGARVLQRRR